MFDHGIKQEHDACSSKLSWNSLPFTLKDDQNVLRSYHSILEGLQPQRSMGPRSMNPRLFIHSFIHSFPKQLVCKGPILFCVDR